MLIKRERLYGFLYLNNFVYLLCQRWCSNRCVFLNFVFEISIRLIRKIAVLEIYAYYDSVGSVVYYIIVLFASGLSFCSEGYGGEFAFFYHNFQEFQYLLSRFSYTYSRELFG